MEGNRDAVQVFGLCKTQVITGFDSIIDINILAVKMAMDLHGIVNQKDCVMKVRIMFNEYKEALDEKRKNAKPQD